MALETILSRSSHGRVALGYFTTAVPGMEETSFEIRPRGVSSHHHPCNTYLVYGIPLLGRQSCLGTSYLEFEWFVPRTAPQF